MTAQHRVTGCFDVTAGPRRTRGPSNRRKASSAAIALIARSDDCEPRTRRRDGFDCSDTVDVSGRARQIAHGDVADQKGVSGDDQMTGMQEKSVTDP